MRASQHQNFKIYPFCWQKMAIFGHFLYAKTSFFEILVLRCPYGSNTLEKVKTMLEVPFPMIWSPHIMYTHLPPCIYTKKRFFTCGQGHFFHLWGPEGQLAVDQLVNRCWPKFQILKSDVSALCSYFYSSQNPFPGSGILHLLKKVPFFRKHIQIPPPV